MSGTMAPARALPPGYRAATMGEIWQFVRTGFGGYLEDEPLTRGAAIAFYAITAVAPTLFIAVTIASLVIGPEAALGVIGNKLRSLMSRESAETVQFAIRHARGTPSGVLSNVLGALTLILTASGVFGEMEDALNVIWRAPRKGSVLRRLLLGRVISLVLVICLGFLLLFSMVVTAALAALGQYIDRHTPYSAIVLATLNFTISMALMSLLLAAIYKILPNKTLEWRDVVVGAVGAALLLQLGQYILAAYVLSSGLAAPYGAAGGLIVLLLWTYYSAQGFLLGAEFTKAYAYRFGSLRV